MEAAEAIRKFIGYVKLLKGDEKGEAQVFCDRLFQAFGHAGYKEAGAELESRQKKKGKGTRFVDLIWKPRLLLEMKKRGEKLQKHYTQAFDYWLGAVPKRPRYVVLCNFDEFWIYDFDNQLYDPVDRIPLKDLPDRYAAFNFLFPEPTDPQFGNNRVDVTRLAAAKVAAVYNSLVDRGENPDQSQRFVLQCVLAMFAQSTGLLPVGLFSELLNDCKRGQKTYDVLGRLFHQMNSEEPAKGGKLKEVQYFNGGLFAVIQPLDLAPAEIELLSDAASENWSRVQPAIFGTLFQSSMGKEERHALGAHFTSEAEIQKVVLPTIVRPWRKRIAAAQTLGELGTLLRELRQYQVLDPACGSGNFLYVAYRELVRLELELMAKIHSNFSRKERERIGTKTQVSIKQLHGIEKKEFGAELAKVTVMLAKELALDEAKHWLDEGNNQLTIEFESALPLDNLDDNIVCDDALFCEWPAVDAIVGNPPFQSKNKAQEELGAAYMNKVRRRYPDVPGRADYCVYWIRRSHDELPDGGRAGLVGTKTIRQNYSRVGGLDYVVQNGGTITEAVSKQVWPGDAVVHVSIVNWVKGKEPGPKTIYTQVGDRKDSPWKKTVVERINSALSDGVDVTQAVPLAVNADSTLCMQGQTHGHKGFLLTPAQARSYVAARKENREVLFPYMIGLDLLKYPPKPSRYVIDFQKRDVLEASHYEELIEHLKDKNVLAAREAAAVKEEKRNAKLTASAPTAKGNKHHEKFLNKWWQLSYQREEMIGVIRKLKRYAACVRSTKRPVFAFLDSSINPGDALQVFAAEDDYSFGIVQSNIHWLWFVARCSTLKSDFRYTSDTVFDTYPWPQQPTLAQCQKVATAAVKLRGLRAKAMDKSKWGLRKLYRALEVPGDSPLKAAQTALDAAVREAYGMPAKGDPLQFLLDLNRSLAANEKAGKFVAGPGLPPSVKDRTPFVTDDCIVPDDL